MGNLQKKKYHRGRRKKKKKGGIISTLILIVALVVFIVSGVQLIRIYLGYHKGEAEYDDLTQIAIQTEDTDDGEFYIDFDALREINPDVVGWIRFEEPEIINYPVVQGVDNDQYLYTTFKGYDNTMGTIFVNAYNNADFNDRNTIIYGHYMYNGTMFNELEEYMDEEFWKEHPYFYIYTPDGAELKYEIYAAGVVKDTSEGYTYQFADDEAFQSFLNTTKASGAYDTGVQVDLNSQIVTLSTCTKAGNSDRMVIHAVKVEVNP